MTNEMNILADVPRDIRLPSQDITPVVIEPFFTPDFAAELVAQFPPAVSMPTVYSGNGIDQGQSIRLGNDAENPLQTGAMGRLFAFGTSRIFANWVKQLTGFRTAPSSTAINLVVHQPGHAGLQPHVDHRQAGLGFLRPLSLVVYLSDLSSGGAFTMARDERSTFENPVFVHQPRFNTAVVFSRTEVSWHGITPVHSNSPPRLTVTIVPQGREFVSVLSALWRRGRKFIRE